LNRSRTISGEKGTDFCPGANGTTFPYGSCTAVTPRSNTAWTVDGSVDADYGGVTMNCTVGNTTGWFGAYATTASLVGTSTIVQGYPGDKAQQQWTATDQVRENTALRLYYDNDTVDGSSGSAVYNVRAAGSAACAGQCSLAFHARSIAANGHNSGPRMTSSRLTMVVGWR
jgi:glutamyl endopeptidase